LREQIEQMNADIERAEQQGDYEKAAKLKYGSLPEAQKQLAHEEKLAQDAQESNLLRDKVTEEEIAKIVERWTGIPVARLWRASGRSSCTSATPFTSGWWDRTRPSPPSPRPF